MCEHLSADFWGPSCTLDCIIEKICSVVIRFTSLSEISTIIRRIVLCNFVAVLVMVKLHVYKSVLLLRATSGPDFAASCSHLKENLTGLDVL